MPSASTRAVTRQDTPGARNRRDGGMVNVSRGASGTLSRVVGIVRRAAIMQLTNSHPFALGRTRDRRSVATRSPRIPCRRNYRIDGIIRAHSALATLARLLRWNHTRISLATLL